MTKQIIESILAPIRALIMRSRPAYKDYLGEETVEEKRVLVSGAFGDTIESSVTFTEGETYLVNLDGIEQEMAAQDITLLLIGDSTTYGFSNIDVSRQIIVFKNSDGYSVVAGISRANQTISVYHGETLILDCTTPSTGDTDFPTVVMGVATLHDESFSGFVQGEAYTIVAGEEAPVTGFVDGNILWSFDGDSAWYICSVRSERLIVTDDVSGSHTNFSISQNVTTVKKRYDIKLLPEDLLPKTVAKKVDVQRAQSTANAAATKNNPVFTGSFSQNRKAGSTIGAHSHAEGYCATASGINSHAEGCQTTASGGYSHAEGFYTTASGDYSHAEGKYNIPDTAKAYAHIVGNGSSGKKQSNAHTLDWSGNAWFAGDVYVGSTSGTNKDDGSKKIATQEYVDGKALGMDITGAAVGQIAKISAVDENGVPTAWIPVDMPSGGGETWELINETDMAEGGEEVTAITFSVDKNGDAFSLKKAKLFYYFPKYTGGSPLTTGAVYLKLNNTPAYCYTTGFQQPTNTAAKYGDIDIDLTLEGLQVEWIIKNSSPSSVQYGAAKVEAITSVSITNALMYSGCWVKLYGVRA